MIRTVYLDQWAWIGLARAHYGKSEPWKPGYDAVMSSVQDGSARFPLSLSNLAELAKRRDAGSRGRLADFMAQVWNADAIRPWPQMLDPEAKNAVRIMMDKSPIDLRTFVFGKGISHIVGGVPTVVPKRPAAAPLSPSVLRRLAEYVTSPSILATIAKDSGFAKATRDASRRDEGFMANVQAAVDADAAHPDKTKRHDIAEARFMTSVVGEALGRAMMDASPNPKAWVTALMSSREQISAIRQNMPTFHTFFVLNYARNTTRRVKGNDLWDLALNIAIPYCDIVVTETSWCNIAREAELDKLYTTELVHDPDQLAALLDSGSSS